MIPAPTQLRQDLDRIEARMKVLEDERAQLAERRDTLLRKVPLACESNAPYGEGCGKKTKIQDLTYIQEHWYVEPSGCTEGGYWRPCNEAQWLCPHCGHRNRAYSTLTKYTKTETGPRPWVLSLKRYFGKIVDEHER